MVAVALAFGITALLCPMRFYRAPPSVLVVPLAAAVLLGALLLDGRLSRLDGAVLLTAYAAAVAHLLRLARRGVSVEAQPEAAETIEHPPPTGRAVLTLMGTLVVLVVGSELIVDATRDFVADAGWSESAVGMSIVALAVSIEELARELPAAARGHAELSAGNVLGSVLAFFLFNAGVIGLVRPVAVPDEVVRIQLPVVLAAVAGVTTLLAWQRVGRFAGLGLVALYAAFVTTLYS